MGLFADADRPHEMLGCHRDAETIFLGFISVPDMLSLRQVCRDGRISVATWKGDTGTIAAVQANAVPGWRACFPICQSAEVRGPTCDPSVSYHYHPRSSVLTSWLQLLAGINRAAFTGCAFHARCVNDGMTMLGPGLRSLHLDSCTITSSFFSACANLQTLRLGVDLVCAPALDLRPLSGSLIELEIVHDPGPSLDWASLKCLANLQRLTLGDFNSVVFEPDDNPMLASLRHLTVRWCDSRIAKPLPDGFTYGLCPRLETLDVPDGLLRPQHLQGFPASCHTVGKLYFYRTDELVHLRHVRDLKMHVSHLRLSVRPSEQFSLLTSLRRLHFAQPITDKYLEYVPGTVEHMDMTCGQHFTGAGLAHVPQLTSLRMWTLPNSLASIPVMPNLTRLDVSASMAGRDVSTLLSCVPGLQWLSVDLAHGPVTLSQLGVCPRLEDVTLYSYHSLHHAIPWAAGLTLTETPPPLRRLHVQFRGLPREAATVTAAGAPSVGQVVQGVREAVARANSKLGLPLDSHARWELMVRPGTQELKWGQDGSRALAVTIYRTRLPQLPVGSATSGQV